MNKKIVYIYIGILLIIDIIALFVLPETMIMQVSTSGEANWTLNKFLGIGLLFLLGIVGGVSALNSAEANKTRSYLLMAVILVVHLLMFVFNL